MGRPSEYNEKTARRICEGIISGMTLRQICAQDGMPAKSTVFKWLSEKDDFSDQYARARELQSEHLADEILEICDDGTNDWMLRENKDGSTAWQLNGEHVQRSRLRVDSRKWLMSKMAPKRYGDKQQLEHTGKDGGPIETNATIDPSKLSSAALRELVNARTEADE